MEGVSWRRVRQSSRSSKSLNLEPLIPPHRHSDRWRHLARLTVLLSLMPPMAFALMLQGCMDGHDRPGGHTDVRFDISSQGDRIVFNAAGEGGRDLYLLDLRSLKVTRIAATQEYEVGPRFSPDGNWVVYAAGRPGDRADHIFLRSLDGKTVKQLTAEEANDASPA